MSSNISSLARNVYGEPLVPCSFDPVTGFFRDGCCKTCDDDIGNHVICAVMNPTFLMFSEASGNDLSSTRPGFKGLQPGDQWCLCASRWMEAWRVGMAPHVVMESTNQEVLEIVSMEVLQRHAFKPREEQDC